MYIYKTTNLVNGKIYVGKHESKYPLNYLGSGKRLKIAIEKYGVENFSKEILQECSTREELVEAEKYWVEALNARDPNVGYNLAKGGQGVARPLGYKRRSMTDAEKAHLSAIRKTQGNFQKGRKRSAESKQRISNARKGPRSEKELEVLQRMHEGNRGRKATLETRQKMSEGISKSRQGKELTEKQRAVLSRMAEKNKGRHLSAETIEKMLASRKRNKEERAKEAQTNEI